ncbi:hypothetical protein SKAU_G00297370 [Synaphobranchus kaupii]|uniref:Uncharacterized protein n=1 Tax=Synaphobranchus kaupii TaxID=118154 RepID=A0A9Q1EV08_SYNKA|nr:hypothetical protein SKAU_G00297370 [Synaphobranchus kaupii]
MRALVPFQHSITSFMRIKVTNRGVGTRTATPPTGYTEKRCKRQRGSWEARRRTRVRASVFFKELIVEFRVGYSDTAWISSILLAMLYGTGPLCSVLVNRFGCRPVMMVGGLFASLGMILASFSTSILHIYLCTGIITDGLQIMYIL